MRADLDLQKEASSEVYGKHCSGCRAALDFIHFRKDSSITDGHSHLCWDCEAQPALSTEENLSMLQEKNYNAEATKKQRWDHQEELIDPEARVGRPMRHSDFFLILQKLVPNLYITQGRIIGHLAVYQTAPCPQTQWNNRDFRYLFFSEEGTMPEFSQYQVDEERDIVIRESKRGWRTVLLRLVKLGLLDEETCGKVFGRPEGPSAQRYNRELYKHRNKKQVA